MKANSLILVLAGIFLLSLCVSGGNAVDVTVVR